jgi:hypothetical protein
MKGNKHKAPSGVAAGGSAAINNVEMTESAGSSNLTRQPRLGMLLLVVMIRLSLNPLLRPLVLSCLSLLLFRVLPVF